MLGITIVTITKVTSKVAMCSHMNKMVLTAKMAEHKFEVAYSILNIVIFTRKIGLAIKPNQTKVATRSVEP